MKQIGSYKIIETLGSGFYGEVYLATKDENEYAIKEIDGFYSKGLGINDLTFVKTLEHPYLIKTYDYIILNDKLYIIMELADTTLGNLIEDPDSDFPYDTETSIRLIYELVCVISAIHSSGYIHDDLYDEQIGVKNNSIRLLDFSLARKSESENDIADEQNLLANLLLKIMYATPIYYKYNTFKTTYIKSSYNKPKEMSENDYLSLMNSIYRLYKGPDQFKDTKEFLNADIFINRHYQYIPPYMPNISSNIINAKKPCNHDIIKNTIISVIKGLYNSKDDINDDIPIKVVILAIEMLLNLCDNLKYEYVDILYATIFISNSVLYPDADSVTFYTEDDYLVNNNRVIVHRYPSENIPGYMSSIQKDIIKDIIHYNNGISYFDNLYSLSPSELILRKSIVILINGHYKNSKILINDLISKETPEEAQSRLQKPVALRQVLDLFK